MRASAVGVYHFWRDLAFAIGALLAGVLADIFGVATAILVIAAVTGISGVIVAIRMYETRPVLRGRFPEMSSPAHL